MVTLMWMCRDPQWQTRCTFLGLHAPAICLCCCYICILQVVVPWSWTSYIFCVAIYLSTKIYLKIIGRVEGSVCDQHSIQIGLNVRLDISKISTTIICWWCCFFVNDYHILKSAVKSPTVLFTEVKELYEYFEVLNSNSRSPMFAFQHLCFPFLLYIWVNFQWLLWLQWNFIKCIFRLV